MTGRKDYGPAGGGAVRGIVAGLLLTVGVVGLVIGLAMLIGGR